MMDVEKMSNEELAGLLEGTEVNYNASVLDESANRLRTSMHWLPMTPDAVFEDGDFFLVSLPSLTGNFNINIASYQTGKHYPIRTPNCTYRRESITHYARITEPK